MISARTTITCLALLVCCGEYAFTRPSPDDSVTVSEVAGVKIFADIDSALVFLDGSYVGRTPFAADSLRPGTYIFRISHPHIESWLGTTVTDSLVLAPGQTQTLHYAVRSYVSVNSQPSGAGVYLDDSLAGTTPFLLHPSLLHPGLRVALKKEGFETVSLGASELSGSVFQTALKAGWQRLPPDESQLFVSPDGWSTRRIGLYVSGGVSVLAGIAAAYFKIAADERQAAYLQSGTPALLTERRRLDTWAGVSFALTQVGLALFCYLLISE